MLIKDDLKSRLSEEVNFTGDDYDIMCKVIDDFFESKLQSAAPTNTTKVTISPCVHSMPDTDGSDDRSCGRFGGQVCCYQAAQ